MGGVDPIPNFEAHFVRLKVIVIVVVKPFFFKFPSFTKNWVLNITILAISSLTKTLNLVFNRQKEKNIYKF